VHGFLIPRLIKHHLGLNILDMTSSHSDKKNQDDTLEAFLCDIYGFYWK
jgi:predicted RNase H-like nuclease